MARVRHSGFCALVALMGILFLSLGAFAAGVVSSANENALTAAMAGGGAVTFAINGTIYLTHTIVISNDTVVDATGHNVTISGGNSVQIFVISSGITAAMTNLTFTEGLNANSPAYGGAISNGGELELSGCMFLTNSAVGASIYAGAGGAVYNTGTFAAAGVVFAGNSATGGSGNANGFAYAGGSANGGAVYNSGQATLVNCSFNRNSCAGGLGGTYLFETDLTAPGQPGGAANGGAVCNAGSLVASNNTFSSNVVTGGQGGVGDQGFDPADYPIPGTSAGGGGPGGNGGAAAGAGFASMGGSVVLVNDTFWMNCANGGMGGEGGVGGWAEAGSEHTQDGPGGNGGPGGNAVGGAFCGSGGSLLAWNITAAGNSVSGGLPGAGGPGGAAFGTTTGAPGTNGTPGVGEGDSIGTLGGTVTLKNSIISASFFLDTNIFGPLVDAGYNLDAEYQKVLTNPTSLTRGGAGLAPFGNYGGPTLTMALFPLSPAIDAADPNDFPATDQRGVPRPFGPAPDIGAVENTNTVTISGTITGLQAGDNATVISGGQSTVTALHGGYSIQIDEVTSVISPSNVNYIFMPPFQIVSLESNQTDVNFQAYLLNTVTLALGSDNTLNLTFAQPNYQSFRIEVSTNLSSWTPISSNNSSISFPITNGASSFFRVVSP